MHVSHRDSPVFGALGSTRKPDIDGVWKDFQNLFFGGLKWDVLQKQTPGVFGS